MRWYYVVLAVLVAVGAYLHLRLPPAPLRDVRYLQVASPALDTWVDIPPQQPEAEALLALYRRASRLGAVQPPPGCPPIYLRIGRRDGALVEVDQYGNGLIMHRGGAQKRFTAVSPALRRRLEAWVGAKLPPGC